MTKIINSNKTYLRHLSMIILGMLKRGCVAEASILQKFIENKDSATMLLLSKKFKRIFNDDDVKEMANVVKLIIQRHAPYDAVFNPKQENVVSMYRNVVSIHKPSRK